MLLNHLRLKKRDDFLFTIHFLELLYLNFSDRTLMIVCKVLNRFFLLSQLLLLTEETMEERGLISMRLPEKYQQPRRS